MKCPKCGRHVHWIEHRRTRGHVYIYAAHVVYVNGKKKVEKCYLGPDRYTYATAQHAELGLVLKGAGQDIEGEPRAIEYLETLTKAIGSLLESKRLSPAKAVALAETLEGLATRLREYAKARAEGGKQ